jgi:SAM-dependent methyltransferase
MSKKLLLCCGPTRPAGFVRLDSNPKHQPDILATIPPLPPAARGPWDEIDLIHGIEHLWSWDARPLLRECYDVLRPGGVLVLEQPNIAVAARVLLGLEPAPYGGVLESAMWPLYGDPAHKDEGYMHRWGYTPATLSALVREVATWSKVEVLPQRFHAYAKGRDFRIEATK